MRGVHFRAFIPNAIIIAICLTCAALATWRASLVFGEVFQAYFMAALGTTVLAVLIWVFHQIFRCMLRKADNPIHLCIRRLKPRAVLLLLPAIFSPLFLCSYTTAKAAIPRLTTYSWDATFTALDRAIFGVDPWIITHYFIGPEGTSAMAFLYSFWGVVLVVVQTLVVLYARGRLISQFYMTMLAAWLIGGVWLAFMFASGGPAFAHLFDPSLQDYFKPLLAHIAPDSIPGQTQAYLGSRLGSALVEKGGGISAMPSMHIAAVTVYVMAARGTRWFWPALAFAILIWIGSVHLAFHYAVDGIASALMVALLWRASALTYEWMLRAHSVPRHRPNGELARDAFYGEGALSAPDT